MFILFYSLLYLFYFYFIRFIFISFLRFWFLLDRTLRWWGRDFRKKFVEKSSKKERIVFLRVRALRNVQAGLHKSPVEIVLVVEQKVAVYRWQNGPRAPVATMLQQETDCSQNDQEPTDCRSIGRKRAEEIGGIIRLHVSRLKFETFVVPMHSKCRWEMRESGKASGRQAWT